MPINIDEKYMAKALLLAEKALSLGEAPIGAIVVGADGGVIGEGFNNREQSRNPLGHAEIIAIEQAAAYLKDRRLDDCSLYVTLEPCLMCAGAIMLSRIKRLVYGAYAPKTGAITSVAAVYDCRFGYKPMTRGGILEAECAALMSRFGGELRA